MATQHTQLDELLPNLLPFEREWVVGCLLNAAQVQHKLGQRNVPAFFAEVRRQIQVGTFTDKAPRALDAATDEKFPIINLGKLNDELSARWDAWSCDEVLVMPPTDLAPHLSITGTTGHRQWSNGAQP